MTGSSSSTGQINVTPLIDVLLVLLIIFMVITPLSPVGLRAGVPQPPRDVPPSPIDPTVVVQIASDHSVRINAEASTLETMGARLEQIFRTRAERTLFVQGAADLEFRTIARAIDISRTAGVDRVGLLGPRGDVRLPPQ
jgi:biopolymer transport protein ExbD